MNESNLTTMFSKFLSSHPRQSSEVYEFKCVKTSRFPFSSVKPHQIDGLTKAKQGLWHKISDSPIFKGMNSKFTAQKPFDAVWIKASESYVVPIFYKPRAYKKAYLIPINKFLKLEGKSAKMEDLDRLGFEAFYL